MLYAAVAGTYVSFSKANLVNSRSQRLLIKGELKLALKAFLEGEFKGSEGGAGRDIGVKQLSKQEISETPLFTCFPIDSRAYRQHFSRMPTRCICCVTVLNVKIAQQAQRTQKHTPSQATTILFTTIPNGTPHDELQPSSL